MSWYSHLVEESIRRGDKQEVRQRQKAGSDWDRQSDPWQGNTYALLCILGLGCRVGDVGDAINFGGDQHLIKGMTRR